MKKSLKQKGFTLIETLVAITVLILGVTGAYVAATQSITNSIYAKEQVIAFYLAQEAVEKIRNTRDTNAISGLNWLHNLAEQGTDPCYFGNSCYGDIFNSPNGQPFNQCSGAGACPDLYQDPTTGFYSYNSSAPNIDSGYNREIVLTQINAHEVEILVTVSWSKGTITRTFRVQENLYQWE